jgi:hypothetical protein
LDAPADRADVRGPACRALGVWGPERRGSLRGIKGSLDRPAARLFGSSRGSGSQQSSTGTRIWRWLSGKGCAVGGGLTGQCFSEWATGGSPVFRSGDRGAYRL